MSTITQPSTELKSFSLELKSRAVDIGGKKYKVSEFTGSGRDAFFTDMASRSEGETTIEVKGVTKKVPKITKAQGINQVLLSLTLRDENNKLVPVDTLNEWPASLLSELAAIANEVNMIGKDEEEAVKEAKNG